MVVLLSVDTRGQYFTCHHSLQSLSGDSTQFSFSILSAFSCAARTKYGSLSDIEKWDFSILSILYWVEIASLRSTEEFSKSLPWHLTKNLESGCLGNVFIMQNKTKQNKKPLCIFKKQQSSASYWQSRILLLRKHKTPQLEATVEVASEWLHSFKRRYIQTVLSPLTHRFLLFLRLDFFSPFCLFAISWAAPLVYGGSQARGQIGAVAAGLRQSHSNLGSEPCLRPTPQLSTTPDR